MSEWTTIEDVKDRYIGGDLPASDAEIQVLIDDAEDIVRREIEDIEDLIEGGTVPPSRVKRIVARMVIRVLRNPDGYRSTNLTTGPFSQGFTLAGDNPGELTLTDEDKDDLVPGLGGQRAFSVDLMPEGAGNEAPIWGNGDYPPYDVGWR